MYILILCVYVYPLYPEDVKPNCQAAQTKRTSFSVFHVFHAGAVNVCSI